MIRTFTSRIQTISIKALLIFLYLTYSQFNAQAQKFKWVQVLPTPSNGTFPIVCTDRFNNSFLYGEFNDYIKIGDKVYKEFKDNYNDVFLVKYSPEGNILWSNFISTPGHENPRTITTDLDGNIYISIQASTTITIMRKFIPSQKNIFNIF
jgi:hypothetical protein